MPILTQAAYLPVGNHSGVMSENLGLIDHVQQGLGGLFGWFNNPSSGSSSTWWVSKTGQIEQYGDSNTTMWAQMAGNTSYCSVESEGYDNERDTDQQILAKATIYVAGVRWHNWPLALAEAPGMRGFGWHGMGGSAWGGHLGCPGDLRKAQRGAVLYIASLVLNPHPLPPEVNDMDDNLFIRWCYMTILMRPVDPSGFAANNAWLMAGGPRWDVYAHLYDSPEGQMVTAARRKAIGV